MMDGAMAVSDGQAVCIRDHACDIALVSAIRQCDAHWISLDGVGVLPHVDAQHPHPAPGKFTLSLDGVPLADVGPHGQFIHWFAKPTASLQ
ncbi:MAG: hypothetical protein ABIW32_07820 [Terrimesophilobacter sp.]